MRHLANVRGAFLEVHAPGDYVSDTIRSTGDYYEAAILDEIRKRVRGGVLVDAGAMIGNHTHYLARFVPHSAIHAFEPFERNLRVLERNMAAFPTVVVHPIALSDRPRVAIDMGVDPTNLGHAVITMTDPWPQENLERFQAPTATLDSYGLEDVTLLKLDVEWHEPAVLAGARETIARSRPLIVLEDWRHEYGALLPDYRLGVEWERAHQTFMYVPD